MKEKGGAGLLHCVGLTCQVGVTSVLELESQPDTAGHRNLEMRAVFKWARAKRERLRTRGQCGGAPMTALLDLTAAARHLARAVSSLNQQLVSVYRPIAFSTLQFKFT